MIKWGSFRGVAPYRAVSFWRCAAARVAERIFPGMIFYLSTRYPASIGTRDFRLFIAVPVANAAASVISGAILEMDGILGLHGWQWVFILEAIPAVLLAFVVLTLLTDRPAIATWLSADQREWLEMELRAERSRVESTGRLTLLRALTDKRVLILSMIYFTSVIASYGITFFLPQIVKGFGHSNFVTGLLTAIPYVIGVIGLVLWGHSSDRRNERRWHLIVASTVAALGLAGWAGLPARLGSCHVVALSESRVALPSALPSMFLTVARPPPALH